VKCNKEGHLIEDFALHEKKTACSSQKLVLVVDKNEEGNFQTNDNVEEHNSVQVRQESFRITVLICH
jgi:hypothetical protein